MILVGSQAMRWHLGNWADNRLANIQDYDFICTSDEFKSLVNSLMQKGNKLCAIEYPDNKAIAKFVSFDKRLFVIDASLIDKVGQLQESDAQIHDWVSTHYGTYKYKIQHGDIVIQTYIVTPNLCYLMKLSHKFKKDSPHFEKTRNDIIWFETKYNMDREKLSNQKAFEEMLDLREKLTYNNKLPKLNQDKKDFFTDSVPYQYDHDTIHEAVKHLDKPAYMYYIKDGEQVMCDVNKWNELPEIVKLYGVLEESYVLALERSIIPFNTNPERAFTISLQKVCTSITSGWFREFAWQNYDKVKTMYHESFVKKFTKALEDGKIAPHSK